MTENFLFNIVNVNVNVIRMVTELKMPNKHVVPDKVARYSLKKQEIGIKKEIRLVIISDTHVTSNAGNFNEGIFKKGVEILNSINNIDYIIHLGDITNDGTVSDYEYYDSLVKGVKPELREKLLYIPGNHDAKNVGYELYCQYISKDRNFTIELDNNSVLIGIDSTEPDDNAGEIGFRTTNMYRDMLFNYDGLKIVCFHHQLVPIPKTGRERSAITDAGHVLKMLLDTNVNLVLNGHRHISNLYSMTDGDGELLVFNAGTFSCNKTRLLEQWTYTVIDLNNESITFQIKPIHNADQINIISRPFFKKIMHDVNIEGKERVARIIHIATTSFSADGGYDERAWLKAVNEINSLECDLVVHSGNLVGRQYEKDFIVAKRQLEDINQPLLVIPGHNETLYPMSWEYYKEYIGPLDPVFENEKLLFIGINSCKLQTKNGVIGRRVLEKVITKAQSSLKNKIVGITLYHDPIPSHLERWEAPLIDAGDTLSRFALSGIDLILSSSSYANWSVQVENAIFSSCSSICDKKAFLFRDVGNSFNIIDLYRDGTTNISEYQVQKRKIVHKRIFQIPVFI
ncbi:MAG: metallophosphoesterase family protein [Promethearchaeota archaeon]